MRNNRIRLEKKQVKELKERLSKASGWMPMALCLLVIVCYGIYLLQCFRSSLSFASKYKQYVNLVRVSESLYLFGKLGLIAFAMAESGILLGYVRSRTIGLEQFMYILALVIVSNLVIYAFISYIYGYAITIIQ